MKDIKIGVIGGDKRQIVMAEELAKDGYEVAVYGFDNCDGLENVTRCTDLICAVRQADLMILPLPYSHDKIHINAPLSGCEIHLEEFFRIVSMSRRKEICGGKFDETAFSYAEQYDVALHDYYEREELTILNAIPTAESAISIAIQEMPIILDGSSALVTGFGRIGKLLSMKLKALGCKVTVAARKKEDFAWIQAYGCKSVSYEQLDGILPDCDVIFNTVPHLILDDQRLEKVGKNSVIIDLASKPGGVAFAAAKTLGLKVVWALSLPGKFAPISSGLMLADTVRMIMDEESIT
ncbi:MAG: dipicolinate synthase subunit DpsA [Eubacteriales bacterium]